MSDDLDRDLRAMLSARAEDVRSVPERLLTLDPARTPDGAVPDRGAEVLELGLRRADALRAARRQWPLLLAAAAVIAVLAGVLVTVNIGPHAHPAVVRDHHSATPVPTDERSSCVVRDAAQWNADVRGNSFVPSGITATQGAGIQAVLANGDAVIEYIRGGYRGGSIGTELGVLAPDASSPRDLGYFSVPSHGNGTSFAMDVEADPATHIVVVSVEGGSHNHGPFVRTIYALDVDTGHRTLLTTQSRYPHGQLQAAYVQDGTVYYEVDASQTSATDVYAVPVSGGTPRRVGGEGGVALQRSALGVTWNDRGPIERPADVPAVVARHAAADTADTFDSFVTDGSAYAWATASGALQWYSPRAGRVVSFPHLLGGRSGLSLGSAVNAVAGPLVYFQGADGDSQWVLDTRSGARVRITSGGTMLGAAGGIALGDPLLAGGEQPQSGQFMRLDASTLAPLAC